MKQARRKRAGFRGWLSRLLAGERPAGGPAERGRRGGLQASFDAARSSADNRRNWEHADGRSGDAAADPLARRTLAQRSTYEALNNPTLYAQTHSLANDVIGPRGPTLQAGTPDERLNRALERAFRGWAREIGLSHKLRLLRRTRAGLRGDALGLLTYNPAVAHAVQLDLQIIEGDQCATPDLWARGLQRDSRWCDGIEFDAWNNPAWYHILRRHPGDIFNLSEGLWEYDRVPAADVLHYYREERAGQRRGIPETTPGLTLHSQRRRWRAARLAAAETEAYFAVMIETPAGAAGEEFTPPEFEELELPRSTAMVLPAGSSPHTIKPENSSGEFSGFDQALVGEAARCYQQPRNVALGDSSNYNYASTRADHQSYGRAIEVDRDDLDHQVLWPLLARFCVWANAVPGLLPASGRRLLPSSASPRRRFDYVWFWSEREHVDPLKEASAVETRLRTRTTTLAAEYARQGKDWEAEVAQLEREQAALGRAQLALAEPVNGPALLAAAELLNRVRSGTLTPAAAIELLGLLNVPRAQAQAMVAATPVLPAAAAGAGESETDIHELRDRRNGQRNGNGVAHA